MRYVSNPCNLSKAKMVPKVREWCGVRKEGREDGVEKRRGRRDLGMVCD